ALKSKDPGPAGHDICGVACLLLGKIDAASREADASTRMQPKYYSGKSLKAIVAAARGEKATTEALIKSFEDDANHNHWAAIRVAMCYAKLGDRDHAIQWLKRSKELGHHSWYELNKHRWFASLQPDSE